MDKICGIYIFEYVLLIFVNRNPVFKYNIILFNNIAGILFFIFCKTNNRILGKRIYFGLA